MSKKLLAVPFVLLAVVIGVVALRANRPAPTPSSTTATASVAVPQAPVLPGGGEKIVLTKKESEEIGIHLTPEQCAEVQKQVQVMPDPPPRDQRAVMLFAACMRHGNVAWKRCTDAAQTRADINACSHRLLFNELAP